MIAISTMNTAVRYLSLYEPFSRSAIPVLMFSVKILYGSGPSCTYCVFNLGHEYIFPITIETRCSHRTNQCHVITWLHRFIVSSHHPLTLMPLTSRRYFWPSRWGPSYANSYTMCILTSTMSIVMLWVFRGHLSRCNEAAEAEEQTLGLPKGFRYLL
jgi:hypothetical protein